MGRVQLSGRANHVARPDESPYYIGLDRVREDGYDEVSNPDGVMQLGLSENRVTVMEMVLLIGVFLNFDN